MDRQFIVITVKLHGTLRRHRPTGVEGTAHQQFRFTLPAGSTIVDLTRALNIADGLVNAAAVNSEAVPNTARLQDGDEVHLFPPSAGG